MARSVPTAARYPFRRMEPKKSLERRDIAGEASGLVGTASQRVDGPASWLECT